MRYWPSALSQLKIRVELKPVRWTSSPSVPEFVNGLEVRRTLISSCDKALVVNCPCYEFSPACWCWSRAAAV